MLGQRRGSRSPSDQGLRVVVLVGPPSGGDRPGAGSGLKDIAMSEGVLTMDFGSMKVTHDVSVKSD